MRSDNSFFHTANIGLSKNARYVIGIDFDGTVQYLTSHSGIANVPGTPIEGVIEKISATSQTLNPDRANATIGSMSFDIVDHLAAFTNKVRTELDTNDVGLRGRTVSFRMGYATDQVGAGITDAGSTDDDPDFENFALFQTQIINSVETKAGSYSIGCADIQRETKKEIFEAALTYLTASISDTATTIPCLDVSGFEGNSHGTSYTDAPSADVIYIRIDSTKEIIRCPVSGISGNDFTSCVRGRFGTDAQAVEVDQSQASDRRPKVGEYIYLELPAVKLALAILTGDIHGTANVLPGGWHAGVDSAFIRTSDFENIGADLWDTTDDSAGIVLLFDGTDKQDAKRFLETEIYLLLGLFSPVYADGSLGLKRMVPSLADSPYSFEVNDQNVISTGNLKHDMEAVQNNLRVDWNWNGERFIRSTIVVDSASIARHKIATQKRLGFRGLVGARFTEQVIRQLLTSLRDMYTGPPLRMDVHGFLLLNQVEVGDAGRVELSGIRDFTQAGSALSRTMVVHGMTVDWLSGVKLKLFGSSERADEIPPVEATTCLKDAFFSDVGASLSTIPGLMSGNLTNAGSFTLVGSADMNAAASVFYWDNALTISVGTTLDIEGNVQIRVKGFLTINGVIDGTGEGHAAGVNLFDSGQHYYWAADRNVGVPGFIGNSKSHRGLLFRYPDDGGIPDWVWETDTSVLTEGLHQAFPNLVLQVTDVGNGAIEGIPTDLRGGGGSYGTPAGEKTGISGRSFQRSTGGAGGAGGAGLCLICRGGDFGVGGDIVLDGFDGTEPGSFFAEPDGDYHLYGGAGGAGAPGALLWLLDGSGQTFPDLAGHFQAITGDVPAQFALPLVGGQGNQSLSRNDRPQKNMAPFAFDRISGFDQTGVNFRIQYLPCDVPPEEDQPNVLSPPSGTSAASIVGGAQVTWSNTNQGRDDVLTEVWRANEDVRASAVLIATVAGENYDDTSSDLVRARYYWTRAIDFEKNVSVYAPDTSGTSAVAFPAGDQGPITKDPLIRLGAAGWEFFANVGDVPTYDVGSGTKGTDTLDFAGLSGVLIWAQTAARNGPDEWDVEAIHGMTIEVRVRWRYSVAGSGGWTATSRVKVLTAEGDGSNEQPYNVRGTVTQWDENDTVGLWIETTGIVTLEQEDTHTSKPRFLRIRVEDFQNNNGAEYQVDQLDMTIVGSVFAGANKPGYVNAPASESGLFLKDDGTFGTPTGSGVDEFNSRTGSVVPLQADYDSFFLTPAEGNAAYAPIAGPYVNTFKSRSGAVVPAIGDYAAIAEVFTALQTLNGGANLGGTLNLLDNVLRRALIDDFAISHQVKSGTATTAINYTAGQSVLLNMAANITTFSVTNWPASGRLGQVQIEIAQDSPARTINWPGAIDWVNDTAPDISTASKTYMVFLSTRNAGTNIVGSFAWDDQSAQAVTSVFGRNGAITALQADYDGFFLTPAEGNALYALIGTYTNTFNGRSGTVVPIQADYDSFFLTPAEGNAAYAAISHNHNASAITAGTLAVARGGTGVTSSTGTGSTVRSSNPTLAGTVNTAAIQMSDNRLLRPRIEDYAVVHQNVTGTTTTTINYSTGQSVRLTLGAQNITTFSITNWPTTNRKGVVEIELKQGATARTIAWPAAINWPDGIAPDISTVNGRYLIYLTSTNNGTTIDGSYTPALS